MVAQIASAAKQLQLNHQLVIAALASMLLFNTERDAGSAACQQCELVWLLQQQQNIISNMKNMNRLATACRATW